MFKIIFIFLDFVIAEEQSISKWIKVVSTRKINQSLVTMNNLCLCIFFFSLTFGSYFILFAYFMLIFNISFVFIANYLYYKNNQSENFMNLINKRKLWLFKAQVVVITIFNQKLFLTNNCKIKLKNCNETF